MSQPVRQQDARPRKKRSYLMLTAEHETQLVLAWQQKGDRCALHRLITAFAPMAARMARRMGSDGKVADPDLLQQANIGLIRAADRFDADKGFRFSTYAIWWVRAEIQHYIYANMSLVRRPNSADLRKAIFHLARAESELPAGQDLSKAEADERVARALSMSVQRLNELRVQMPKMDASLEAQPYGDEGEDRKSLLPDPATLDHQGGMSAIDTEKVRDILLHALRGLPDRERAIVVATVLTDPPCTLDTLGARYGVSGERVRQLRERGFQRLRDALRRQGLTLDSFV